MTFERMMRRRLIALALFGGLLFSYPVLSLFNRRILIFGFPLLYVYLFAIWAVLIALMAMASSGHGGKNGT